MKSSIIKSAAAIAVGIITATTAVYAGPSPHNMNGANLTPSRPVTTMDKIERGTTRLARETWNGSKAVARTVVHSPAIAYQAVRGERPLFRHETAARERSHREQIALTGHSDRTHRPASKPSQNEPPPI